MLQSLHIRNLAVLAEASVEFGAGLNVLTGETGAGKSIVVDSLSLLAGARASADLIRTGADTLTVTGVFQPAGDGWRRVLESKGVGSEGTELVIRREVSRAGRNRVFVNDQPVTLRLLSELAPGLLRIHGQREELGLVAPDMQRVWLDAQGGAEAGRLLEQCGHRYRELAELSARLERLSGDERLRLERLDLLRFQMREIDAAQLEPGEEVALRQERELLRHAETIRGAWAAVQQLLFEDEGAATERLARSLGRLTEIEEWEPEARSAVQELDQMRILLDELAATVRRRVEAVEDDPGRLDEVESRLATFERLTRKYGSTSEEILAYRARIGEELEELDSDDQARERLQTEVEEAREAYRKIALELSRRRRQWARQLVDRIEEELRELALSEARFAVRMEQPSSAAGDLEVDGRRIEAGPFGIDRVLFEFSPNPGEELRSLARVASGGELSRVYLTLQLLARDQGKEAGATLVFDEVDSGVGGVEAAVVGRKLKRLARGGQILAVTHVPQMACHGDVHFRIRKEVRGERTFVSVEELEGEERVREVARMLAGEEITPLSLSHARELLEGADQSVSMR